MRPAYDLLDSRAAQADQSGLGRRVYAEFCEMPCLRLTAGQAGRLFGLEPAECARVLNGLVQNGMLATDGTLFRTAGSGR